ncbi:DUF4856 domain-containing protein [Winogradskyella sp.]|uniref:DUF4856 domain-containing protein n=1 Tax=Winogradskyella sp. TaxID=1883156 RepID=UPI001B155204|nr:DUF4856 domain-containing protein [Winogradskyella sp.]MBO6880779.1 DUF4856 domain-containing protein [Winogradskyella sp.]
MKCLAPMMVLIVVLFTSCSSSDDGNSDNNQFPVPSTYQFSRNGSSTVSYSQQANGIAMADEFISALSDNGSNEAELNGMFTNTGNYFSTTTLNQSPFKLRSNTAASFDYYANNETVANTIKADFDAWISGQANEVYPNWNSAASVGVAGMLVEADGITTRRVNAKGMQYNQALGKMLLGGLMVDQMLNNYLSISVLDASTNRIDNDNEVLVSGSNYTAMEHSWDAAFGLAFGSDNAQNPQLNQDLFMNKYISRVDVDPDFNGIADDIYDAFKLGRAAIVAKDYELRDQQIDILREKFSEIMGVRCIYYLRQGRSNLDSDKANAFHDLSEGYGFIYALQFTRKPGSSAPYFTKSEVDVYLAQLLEGNGFWDVSEDTLNQIAFAIAARFNFTVEQAEN